MTKREYRRSDPTQQVPPPDLAWVPEGTVSTSPWYREHARRPGADRGCWYYASRPRNPNEPSGRFDLRSPEGTCYFGDSMAVAARERVGRFTTKHQPVPSDFVQDRVVTKVDGGL